MIKKKVPFKQEDVIHIQTSNGKYPDEQTENIMFAWAIKEFGFGTTTFYYENNKLKCQNETLSKESVKKILCAFVDKAEFME